MWIDVNDSLPVAGKYVVKTERNHPLHTKSKLYAKLEVSLTYSEEGTASWLCNNQRVTHWLNEEKND